MCCTCTTTTHIIRKYYVNLLPIYLQATVYTVLTIMYGACMLADSMHDFRDFSHLFFISVYK
jgi:hypothetical protein